MATVLTKERVVRSERSDSDRDEKLGPDASTLSVNSIPPLGVPKEEKRFFFQRTRAYDPEAIATQVIFALYPLEQMFDFPRLNSVEA